MQQTEKPRPKEVTLIKRFFAGIAGIMLILVGFAIIALITVVLLGDGNLASPRIFGAALFPVIGFKLCAYAIAPNWFARQQKTTVFGKNANRRFARGLLLLGALSLLLPLVTETRFSVAFIVAGTFLAIGFMVLKATQQVKDPDNGEVTLKSPGGLNQTEETSIFR